MDIATTRRTLEYHKQDLRRFENDANTPAESIATVKRLIKEKEDRLAFFGDLPLIPSGIRRSGGSIESI